MKEPYLSQFVDLVQSGAARRDIHDSDGRGSFDSNQESRISERFLQREIDRVDMHLRNLCTTLVDHVGQASRILDVGCGTAGTTVALALSPLSAERLIGIDADAATLDAARVRALGYGFPRERVDFLHVPAGNPLPFADASFDLVTCVSVLEFVSTEVSRRRFVGEMLRVLTPGGHLFLATPNPFVLREYHSRRWLGDWVRQPGYPWSSPPWELRRMMSGHERIPLARYRMVRHPKLRPMAAVAPVAQWVFPWQQLLLRKRETADGRSAAARVPDNAGRRLDG